MNTLPKSARLKSRKRIEALFANGTSFKSFPIIMVAYAHNELDGGSVEIAVSVSKKRFKKAVDRNRIKRLLREAYRRNQVKIDRNQLTHQALSVMFLFVGKEMPNFELVEEKIITLLSRLNNSIITGIHEKRDH